MTTDDTPPPVPGLPLSIAQQGLWYLARLDEAASAAYNMVFPFAAARAIDRALLARTLEALQRRHEILRASVQMRDDGPRLVIADAGAAPVIVVAEVADELEGFAQDETARPFDLACAPLVRASVVRADDGAEGLVLTLPHIVFDGPSAAFLFEEMTAVSAQLARGAPTPLEPAPAHCAAFVQHEQAWVASAEGQGVLEAALARLAALPARIALPRHAPPIPGQLVYRTAVLEFLVDAGLAEQLAAAARDARATPAAVYAGAFELLLWHLSGQRDFAITLPVMHRHVPGCERALGYLTNLGVLRATIDGDATLEDFLGEVTDALFEMLEARELPFPLLAQRVKRDRRDPQPPLMQVGFNHEVAQAGATRLGDCALRPLEVPPLWAKNELKLDVLETADGARCWLVVDRDGWDDETVDAMAMHYLELLAAIAGHPERRLADLPALALADGTRGQV
jgi:hypothetical protein